MYRRIIEYLKANSAGDPMMVVTDDSSTRVRTSLVDFFEFVSSIEAKDEKVHVSIGKSVLEASWTIEKLGGSGKNTHIT